jgi:choline dehydrogenase
VIDICAGHRLKHNANVTADADVLPSFADTVVIGAGTAGAAVAGLLAERGDQSVLLLEAGPDYGGRDSGRWPDELLDARALPTSHDWGYDSGSAWPHRTLPFERARVVGGCSAHNGCAEIWGSRLDYDGWAALGNPGWSTDDLLPLFHAGAVRLRVRRYHDDEITPFQAACLAAAPGVGIPVVDDLNDLDADIGIATSPVNIVDGVRWNSAFAYLDPVRGGRHLTIAGNVLVDHLVIRGASVEAVAVVRAGAAATIRAGRVILCAGAYGSPAILLRSGVGAAAELRALGIVPHLDLSGVGHHLHDHPVGGLIFAGTPELERRMSEFATAHWLPEEQTIAKARSTRCARGFDIHIFPTGGPAHDGAGWRWVLPFACMTPRSRGAVRLSDADPSAPPRIDHGYLTDPDGADLQVLLDALELSRALAARPELAPLIGDELLPGASRTARADLADLLTKFCMHYAHPVGTCRMGPAGQRDAVVDARGRVHGLDNAYVADASVMPVIPRANTNMPALVVGLRVAGWL